MPADSPNTSPGPVDQRKRSGNGDLEEREPKRSRKTESSGESQPSDQAAIESMRSKLLKHSQKNNALFYIESPASSNSKCRFDGCQSNIREEGFRVAVVKENCRSPLYYHVDCFEKIADFSKTEYVNRLQPMDRGEWHSRLQRMAHDPSTQLRFGAMGLMDGNTCLDSGASILIYHWIRSMRSLIARRNGDPEEHIDPHLLDILYKSGSSSFKPTKPDGMDDSRYDRLIHNFAPIESDGVDDKKEWNLFEQYVPCKFEDFEDLNRTDSLSSMLAAWSLDKVLVLYSPDRLTDEGKELREAIGEKGTRAIKRLTSGAL
ncbi:uncharacterized protein PG986_005580 [Apiospora aurea]|uniref:PARP-type domain-containing protein n=1 Tax=Apiospora aurea TaxID=335848 RepID=A0ABR1QHY7_9PEZI